MYNQILQGDVLEKLKSLLDETINCVITSPPYYGLRDYGLPPTAWPEIVYEPMAGLPAITIPPMVCCLGLEDSIEAYVGHTVSVFRELWRVLRGDGVAWLNLGDSYSGSWGNYGDAGGGQRTKQTERFERRAYDKTDWRPPTSLRQADLKPKDLFGVPWRVAFALQADGWYLRSDVIWSKKNPMPESVTDRPTKAHEYVFLLTKSAKYWFDQDAIKEPGTNNEEMFYKKLAKKPHKATKDDPELNGLHRTKAGLHKATYNPLGRNKRTVWFIATKPYKEAHFAVMPEALVEPCLLAGCPPQVCEACGEPWVRVVEREATLERGRNVIGLGPKTTNNPMTNNGGESSTLHHTIIKKTTGITPTCACNAPHHPGIVLDPFFGAGTVGVVAEKFKRRWLGIELNEDYVAMSKERIARTQPALFAR